MRLRPRSTALGLLPTTLLALALLPAPAHAAEESSIGRRYNDKLDSRLSSLRLAEATKAIGYTAHGYSGGRNVNDAFIDGLGSSVFGLFGHGNKGIFQTDEGPTDAQDHIFAAGTETDLVSTFENLRFLTEYIPFAEVDDMRLLVVAACYTAGTSEWGDFITAGRSRGIDAVVTFRGLVYYPATASGTSASVTNYSGNYFWHRFSYHVQQGVTVATALARANTDLVAKEGTSGGWNAYVLGGALSNPGGVKLKPAGDGTIGNSQPATATPAYETFAELTPASRVTSADPDLSQVTSVETAEGVSYRTRADGSVLDAVGVPATSGDITLSQADALAAAERFVRRNVGDFTDSWLLTHADPISHQGGDALTLLQWRTGFAGTPGSRAITVEIDRRSGAITYFADTRGAASAAEFTVTEADAIAAARAVAGDEGQASASADVWDTTRWIVTIDRGLTGRPGARVPDVERVEIDARTGNVLAHTTT